MLVSANKSKEKIKNMNNCGVKPDIKSITKNSDDYDKKYNKIKFNLDDKLPLNKMIEITSMIIVVTDIVHSLSQMNVYINYE